MTLESLAPEKKDTNPMTSHHRVIQIIANVSIDGLKKNIDWDNYYAPIAQLVALDISPVNIELHQERANYLMYHMSSKVTIKFTMKSHLS